MTKKEFLNLIYNAGINLKDHKIYFPKYDAYPVHLAWVYSVLHHTDQKEIDSLGEYEIVRALPDHKIKSVMRGNENKCYDCLHKILLDEMRQWGEINDSITPKIAEMTEKEFCQLWQKMDSEQGKASALSDYQEAWKSRLNNIRVLNEIKYYLLNCKFVPKKDAYHPYDYTAIDIAEKTNLDPISAIDFLNYLETDFDNAFSDLIKYKDRKNE